VNTETGKNLYFLADVIVHLSGTVAEVRVVIFAESDNIFYHALIRPGIRELKTFLDCINGQSVPIQRKASLLVDY